MRARRIGGRRRRRTFRSRRGRGFVDWVKKSAGKVNDFLKRTKIISRVAPIVGDVIPGVSGIAGKIGSFASSHGYGRRRRYHRRRRTRRF